jgi:phosphoribosylglycinamide formyltransferase 1
MNKFIVLISGNGSNLEAICKKGLAPHIAAVISNKHDAKGLEIAKSYNLNTHVIEHKKYSSRIDFDQALITLIDKYQTQFIVLAGFMRILTNGFVSHYKNRLINIHPSILPAFIGADAPTMALSKKVKITGITIHFVTSELDSGPIIAQGIVPIHYNDDIKSLKSRIQELEHIIYPFIIRKILNESISIIDNGSVIIKHEQNDKQDLTKYYNQIFY